MTDIIRGRLMPVEKAQIEELSERGFSCGRIAQRLNRLPTTISFYMVTHGLKVVTAGRDSKRGAATVKAFTPDEDEFITALRVQNLTYERIARISVERFGHQRSGATIGIRLKMLAGRDEEA